MRKSVKFLHTMASCGFIGALAAHILLLSAAPHAADPATRVVIGLLGTWLLLPSMAIVLMSGLLSMAVHRPFQAQRWVWTKAALSFILFIATLHLQAMASGAAAIAARIPPGQPAPAALAAELANEGASLGLVLVFAVANIVLGVWRPRLAPRRNHLA